MNKRLYLGLLAFGGLLGAGPVLAGDDHERARALVESGQILPLETILEGVRRHHPGRVLEVEFERNDGGFEYEVELVDESGEVHELRFDAVNGQLLDEKSER